MPSLIQLLLKTLNKRNTPNLFQMMLDLLIRRFLKLILLYIQFYFIISKKCK